MIIVSYVQYDESWRESHGDANKEANKNNYFACFHMDPNPNQCLV